jgi:hypothetical protein
LGKTLNELLTTVDSAELTEWMAYLQLEMERDEPDEQDAWKKAFNVNG